MVPPDKSKAGQKVATKELPVEDGEIATLDSVPHKDLVCKKAVTSSYFLPEEQLDHVDTEREALPSFKDDTGSEGAE
jgi:hypothetical protein